MNNIDYKTKYIKYKTKYLEFVKQYAGVPPQQQTIVPPLQQTIVPPPQQTIVPPPQQPIVLVICTHSARLRCLLNSLGIKSAIKCRFKNCAILKFEIDKTSITISLVYEGEVEDEGGKKYYVISYPTTSNEEQFNTEPLKCIILYTFI